MLWLNASYAALRQINPKISIATNQIQTLFVFTPNADSSDAANGGAQSTTTLSTRSYIFTKAEIDSTGNTAMKITRYTSFRRPITQASNATVLEISAPAVIGKITKSRCHSLFLMEAINKNPTAKANTAPIAAALNPFQRTPEPLVLISTVRTVSTMPQSAQWPM